MISHLSSQDCLLLEADQLINDGFIGGGMLQSLQTALQQSRMVLIVYIFFGWPYSLIAFCWRSLPRRVSEQLLSKDDEEG